MGDRPVLHPGGDVVDDHVAHFLDEEGNAPNIPAASSDAASEAVAPQGPGHGVEASHHLRPYASPTATDLRSGGILAPCTRPWSAPTGGIAAGGSRARDIRVSPRHGSGGSPSPTTAACSRSCASRVSRAGLSWLTILRKREAFREAFWASTSSGSPGSTSPTWNVSRRPRHRPHGGKIRSVINNAACALELRRSTAPWPTSSGSSPTGIRPPATVPATSPGSVALAKELKSGAGRSWAPPPCTRSCRRMGLVTTTSPRAGSARSREQPSAGFRLR